MRFYIIHQHYEDGPYDLVTVIRKIRKGSLSEETLLRTDDEPPVAAGTHPRLMEFYAELGQQPIAGSVTGKRSLRPFSQILAGGWKFLARNQSCSIYSAMLLMLVLAIGVGFFAIMPGMLVVVAAVLTWIVALFGLSIIQLILLRLHRGQPVDFRWFKEHVVPRASALGAYSVAAGVASAIGFALFILPGLFILALFVFAPLIISDERTDFWEAMSRSRKMALSQGLDVLGMTFGCVVINFVSALLFILPLLLSIPITYTGVVDLYEELST